MVGLFIYLFIVFYFLLLTFYGLGTLLYLWLHIPFAIIYLSLLFFAFSIYTHAFPSFFLLPFPLNCPLFISPHPYFPISSLTSSVSSVVFYSLQLIITIICNIWCNLWYTRICGIQLTFFLKHQGQYSELHQKHEISKKFFII